MKTLLITGIIFVGLFFYFVAAFLFFHLVSLVKNRFRMGGWVYEVYEEVGVFAGIVWPVIFLAWIIEMFFLFPWKLAYKILYKKLDI